MEVGVSRIGVGVERCFVEKGSLSSREVVWFFVFFFGMWLFMISVC